MRTSVRTLLAIGGLTAILAAGAVRAQSFDCVVRVSQDGTGDCLTIQECIDATPEGCTILVDPGFYPEDLFLPSARNIRSAGGSGVTTIASSGTPAVPLIEIHTSNPQATAEIRGFTLTADSDGLLVFGSTKLLDSTLQAGGRGVAVDSGAPFPQLRLTITGAEIDAGSAGIDLPLGRAVVERSTIRASQGDGILAGLDSRIELLSSVVSDCSGAGLIARGTARLAFATITHCGVGVRNGSGLASIRIDDSIVWGNGIDLDAVDCFAVHRSDTSPDCCFGTNLCVDPVFTDPVAGDYRPSPGSPVIEAASPPSRYHGRPCLDRDGHQRLLDADSSGTAEGDMGAYEYDDYETSRAPLEVTGLRFVSPDMLAWDPVASAIEYVLFRGFLRQLDYSYPQDCIDRTPDTTALDPERPPSDDGFYYLVISDDLDGVPNTEGLGTCAERSSAAASCPL